MKKSVEHYTDGRAAWSLGFTGFLVRARGIAVMIGITILSMGSPWWLPNELSESVAVNLKLLTVVVVFVIGAIIVIGFIHLRNRTKRTLETNYFLHRLAHDIRDRQTELHKKLAPEKNYSKGKQTKELKLLLTQACENIVTYFSLLTDKQAISAAIRLARYDESERKIVYQTVARSKGLNSQRGKTSEAIPMNQGIPRFLREEKGAQGVLIYNNVADAAELGAYHLTNNDQKYSDDIKTMMVAPLNAWSGKKQDMVGILYITSRESNVFSVKHVDSMAFVADVTAAAIATSIELVRLKCDGQEKRGRA